MKLIRKLSYNEYVHGLAKLNFEKDRLCDLYQMGKQIKILSNPK